MLIFLFFYFSIVYLAKPKVLWKISDRIAKYAPFSLILSCKTQSTLLN
ncbi:hypothetical protein HMPREF1580_00738 [Gardnerella vaginalis JCP8070]|nr:hypothetical protein HMPREF1582_00719 [Gardnerella vaginalis JCP8151A]EPI59724.1 hypothetical protein HMPREF1580_00738 [Gardnerella vaginalis JCP8070]